jgi:GNAT superfamily N-acetyltransferase
VSDEGEVVGYFALAPHVIDRAGAPKSIARTALRSIPAILVAKLALSSTRQGHGLGGALLAVALEVSLEGIKRVGGRLIVVEAIDANAAGFYEHYGFARIPGSASRLVIKASRAASSLGVPWP